jgi:hypothetical protein
VITAAMWMACHVQRLPTARSLLSSPKRAWLLLIGLPIAFTIVSDPVANWSRRKLGAAWRQCYAVSKMKHLVFASLAFLTLIAVAAVITAAD